MSWRFLNAAVAGTSHLRGNLPCQDDCLVDTIILAGQEVIVAIASDGAGSAAHSEEGSGIVCETFVAAVEEWLRDGRNLGELTRDRAEEWIERMRCRISARAEEKERTTRDFACTLVAAIIGSDTAAFLQIGDGAIVIGAGDYEVVFWPDGGEYANMTFFLTDDDWRRHLHLEVRPIAVDEIAVMTDGLQRLALRFDTRTPHAPFFAPMFHALGERSAGYATDLEAELIAFLDSSAVNERTDDDKSLIIATRRAGVAHGTG